MKRLLKNMKYLVGMSGGIDSSVAAVKLKKEGHDVVGAHMILWAEDMRKNKCCSTIDLMWARTVAARHNIPFYVLDFKDIFKKRIVEKSYLNVIKQGRTPNPCVSCNRSIRFGALIEKAKELGIDKVCTGHYANIEEKNGLYKLLKARDLKKDQSYFLHRLTQEKLSKMHLPLGNLLKKEVIKLASQWKLINQKRAKKESQDLCFIPEKTPEPFIRRNIKKNLKEGNIVTTDGKILGKHRGLPFYTIGQRKGIHIGGLSSALYVIEKNIERNQLIVGGKNEGGVRRVLLKNLNLIASDLDESKIYKLKIRSQGQFFRGRINLAGKNYRDSAGKLWDAIVEFQNPVFGITPGQFIVAYEKEYCVGGGEIMKASSDVSQ